MLRRLREVGLVAAIVALVAPPRLAGETPAPAPHPVIKPGQEARLAEIIGRGATFPGGCVFTSGSAAGAVVRATYTCTAGTVTYELRHPDAAPPDVPRTQRFAIVVRDGQPPEGLTSALASNVAAKEAGFEWDWEGVAAKAPPPPPDRRPLLAGVALLLAAAIAWGAWRNRRRLATGVAAAWRGARSAGAWLLRPLAAPHRRLRSGWAAAANFAQRLGRDPRRELPRLLRDERFWVVTILLVSGVGRLWLSIVNHESADDHSVVAHMIRGGGWLPPASSACWECSHAKLYHYTLALFLTWFDSTGDASKLIGNLLNFVAGMALLIVFYRFIRRLPISPTVRVLGLGFMAFNASLVGIFAQTTNDGFCILFASLTIFAIARVLDGGDRRWVLAATSFAILAALSKASGWAIFVSAMVVLAIAVGAAAPRRHGRYLRAAAFFALGFLLVVSMTQPYRDNLLQSGTPFVNDAFKTPHMENEVPRQPTWPLESFLTFRFAELMLRPYIDFSDGPYPRHRISLWSQLYGRALLLRYDRGLWRNFDPDLLWLGRLLLVLGLLPLSAVVLGVLTVVRTGIGGLVARGRGWLLEYQDWQHLVYVAAMLASLCVLVVAYHRLAILHTWMKVIYVLPAVLSAFVLLLNGLERLWQRAPRLVTAWMLALIAASVVDLGWLIHDLMRSTSS
jgi:hypothetical protein